MTTTRDAPVLDTPDDTALIDEAVLAVLRDPLPDLNSEWDHPSSHLLMGAFLRPHLRGLHPYLTEANLPGGLNVTAALPAGAVVLRKHRRPNTREVLAVVDGCLVVLRSWKRTSDIWVSGADEETIARVVASVRARIPEPEVDTALRVTFWHLGRTVVQRTRDLVLPTWAEVSHLYPSPTRVAMEALVAHTPSDGAGRLVLWHGPPGTGKTTAVRALLSAWSEWASPHVVSDPERLLNDHHYLSTVLLDTDEDDDENRRPWRLVIVEDAEELLRHDARARVGPALGRLLNTADGLLGQGSQAIILLTTNEEVRDMHPALLRPGRCLARMEFPAFDPTEASVLLGAPASEPMTLAEIMERRGDLARVQAVSTTPSRVGAYL